MFGIGSSVECPKQNALPEFQRGLFACISTSSGMSVSTSIARLIARVPAIGLTPRVDDSPVLECGTAFTPSASCNVFASPPACAMSSFRSVYFDPTSTPACVICSYHSVYFDFTFPLAYFADVQSRAPPRGFPSRCDPPGWLPRVLRVRPRSVDGWELLYRGA